MAKKGQAAMEYLVTYGWAFMAVLIAIGTLSYFGFINPSGLLPNRCSFGKQLECVEYEIYSDGDVNILFRNNFGKPIEINGVELIEGQPVVFAGPVDIEAGTSAIVGFTLHADNRRAAGEKQDLNLVINFTRDDGIASIDHFISGSVFVTVK